MLMLAGCATQNSNTGSSNSTGSSSTPVTPPKTVPPGTKAKIAFVTNNSSDYWTIASKGVDKAKPELKDADIDFIMPGEGSAAQQKTLVEDEVTKGALGIAISPVDPANQTDWINDLVNRGITVVTQDSDAPNSKRICYIGTDNHAAGVQAGGEIKKALPQGGKIMLFVGKSDAQNAKDRIDGVTDALKGSNITILGTRTDDTDHARAKANAADALTSNPDLAAEVGIWSYNGPAILSAVKDANKIGKVKIVCFDEEDDTLTGVKSGAISATIVQQPFEFGYNGVKLLNAIVHGDKSGVPANGTNFVPTQVINQTNVDAFKANLDKLRGRK
jgi:ribose transport system substrate-binding protein